MKFFHPIWRALSIIVALGVITPPLMRSSALAEYIPPDQVKVSTATYKPHATQFAKGRYSYEVAWQGIRVADAEIIVHDRMDDKVGHTYRVQAIARTRKGIDLLYSLHHRSESVFGLETLKPLRFRSEQNEKRRQSWREVIFEDDGKVVARSSNTRQEISDYEFYPQNQMLDPITAAFLARGLPIEVGHKVDFDVFNGKHRFLITFEIEARETLNLQGVPRAAFRVKPNVRRLTEQGVEKKLRSATIWISDDSAREILRIRSEVFVGAVSLDLTGFTPFLIPTVPKILEVRAISKQEISNQLSSLGTQLNSATYKVLR